MGVEEDDCDTLSLRARNSKGPSVRQQICVLRGCTLAMCPVTNLWHGNEFVKGVGIFDEGLMPNDCAVWESGQHRF